MRYGKYLDVIPKTNPVPPVCFAVSGFAFLACLVGLIVNHWLSGWMAVGGMAGIGLFYLAVGIISLGERIPVYSAGVSGEQDAVPAPRSGLPTDPALTTAASNARAASHRIRNERTVERVD